MAYHLRHYQWYRGPGDRHFAEVGRFDTLTEAKRARFVSGDLITDAQGRLVEPLNSWLWFWEKIKSDCYVRKIWRKAQCSTPSSA